MIALVRNEGRKMMKTKIITILAAAMLLPASAVQAIDVDFYHDAVIDAGDVYMLVSVYDTPPDNTTVDMFGGSVASLRTYDSSIVNINTGEVWASIAANNLSTVNICGGTVTLDSLIVWDSATLNIYGGNFSSGNAPLFSESSTVNIYGYDFNYDGWTLTGFLQDDSPFIFTELTDLNYPHINLIPEPSTFLLFGLGVLLLRKRT